ncbi:DUF1173 family protein [Xanthomonas oryzae pv. oryzae]|nr:DUF1173 domain-containing protein [Xanthomonas oryzae pv. oryzae]QBN29791.1 DUF1173 family protein [Xanthomonas oryzae pv. oryzae]QBN62536.1 DUF1173 family protein [Xanthomonas oryzae pv. oryzae]QBN66180.1 DUF1173 family protein [Xanthomonas oryzae pv. oryzae]
MLHLNLETAQFKDKWQSLLRSWHMSKQQVQCLCRPSSPVRLVLRKNSASGVISLARHPHTGPDHDVECQYSGISTSGALSRAYESGAVEDTDGFYKIRLSAGRSMSAENSGVASPEPCVRSKAGLPRQGTLSCLGLLQLLWELAALNVYRPEWASKRADKKSIAGFLLNAAEGIRWSRASLDNSLQVGPALGKGGLFKHNQQVAATAKKNRTRVIVISPLVPHCTAQPACDFCENSPVPLVTGECIRPLLEQGHIYGLNRSFDRELNAWRKGALVYASLIIEPKQDGDGFKLVQIALMRVSPRAIPLDSDYEAEVEERLVSQSRRFDKPIRYADGDETLPDFRLLDVGTAPVILEVFGLKDADYNSRMQAKIIHYDNQFTPEGWWSWHAYKTQEMPPFPSPSS